MLDELKQIWDAQHGEKETAKAPAPVVIEADSLPADFDPTAFDFEPRAYRITFKNGNSGEYDGAVLARQFPFDPREVERVEPVEEVGQGL